MGVEVARVASKAIKLARPPVPPSANKGIVLHLQKAPRRHDVFQVCLFGLQGTCTLHTVIANDDSLLEIPDANILPGDIEDLLIAPLTGTWKTTSVDVARRHVRGDQDGQDHQKDREDSNETALATRTFDASPHVECLFRPKKEVREHVVLAGKAEWSGRKKETLKYLIGIIAVGAATFNELLGTPCATAFSVGGFIGIFYQLLLQYEIDRIGTHQFIVNSSSRLALVATVAALFANHAEPLQLWVASGGFLMHKVAVWLAFIL